MVCLITSCSESEEIIPEEVPTRLPSSISLTVVRCDAQVDPFCDNPELVVGANMLVYPSAAARMANDSLLGQCTTNQLGECRVNNLDLDTHFLLITTPSGDEELVEQETPAGTNSFLEVIL